MRRGVVVAAAATGAVVVTGVIAYRYWSAKQAGAAVQRPEEPEQATQETSVTPAGTTVETLVTEAELTRVLKKNVAALSSGSLLDRKAERQALKLLQGFEDVTTASVDTRLLVAQYCAAIFSMKMVNPENRALEFDKLMELRTNLEKTYLWSAWEVLNAPQGGEASVDPELVGRWHALKLDVACRMHDSEKMCAAYEKAAQDSMCAKQDKLVLLASAALVGRWDEVRRIGQDLAPTGELDILHAASMKDPSMVDYASLFLLAAQIAGSSSDDHLWEGMRKHEWCAYEVKKSKFKLVQAGQQAPLRPEVTAAGWKDEKMTVAVPMMRTGAIVHMVNPGAVPIPLSGFAGEDDMCLLGYFDVEQSSEQLRFTEFFTFKRDRKRENVWIGKELTTMLCVVGPRSGEKITEVVLDVELHLAVDRKSVWKAL